jgi:hypothetical protein
LEEVFNNDRDLLLPKFTPHPQENNALERASSSEAVSPGLSPTKLSKGHVSPRRLSARRFLTKLLQEDKRFLGAAAAGNVTTVTEQLKCGTEIEVKTEDGWTVLHEAAWNGHEKVVKVQVDSGANTEVREARGRTALDWAIKADKAKILKPLK